MYKYILIAKKINKKYANIQALSSLDLKISSGKIYGIIGPNGAGKTTLFRIINMIEKQDSGDILFNNHKLNINHIDQMGYLPEERGLYKNMGLEEQIIYLAGLKGMKRKDVKIKIKFLLNDLNINYADINKIENLSKGMAQKIQFIISIIHNPIFITLDEPFSGLDPINIHLIINYILKLKKEGKTILLSIHDMKYVELICDHIIFINKSIKIFDSPLYLIKQKIIKNEFKVKINIFNYLLWQDFLKKNKMNISNLKLEHNNYFFKIKINNKLSSSYILNKLINIGDILLYEKCNTNINDIFFKIFTNSQSKNEKNIFNYKT